MIIKEVVCQDEYNLLQTMEIYDRQKIKHDYQKEQKITTNVMAKL